MDTIIEKVQTEIDQNRQQEIYENNKEDIENYIEFACREGVLDPDEALAWDEDERLAYYQRGQLADLYSEPF